MNKHKKSRTAVVGRLLGCGVAALTFAVSPLHAAQTDISSTPITSSSAAQVKPNIMLLMDTSDSMSFGHMPDEVEAHARADLDHRRRRPGRLQELAVQRPLLQPGNSTYALPKRADGSFFPTPSFGAAPYDVYDTLSIATVDLASELHALRQQHPAPRRLDLSAAPRPTTTCTPARRSPATPRRACADLDVGSTQPASDGGTWTRVNVGSGQPAQQTHFAIWYTYYRTRIAMIKSAASLAFTPLTDSFRVGLITVNPKYPNNVPLSADSPNAPINPEKYLRHRRLRLDPAQPLVQQAVLAEDRRHLAGARRPGPGRSALRRQDRRHQHRHAGGSRPVLVPAELHDHDDGRLLERQRRDCRRAVRCGSTA